MEYLSVKEAAAQLDVDPATIRRWCASGKIECQRVGKVWLSLPVVRRQKCERSISLRSSATGTVSSRRPGPSYEQAG